MDLLTLWYLTIGTLLVAAAMTLWERHTHAARARELRVWATGYLALAAGCALAVNRQHFPGVAGYALTNVVIMLGYLLVLRGVLILDGRKLRYDVLIGLLVALGAAWFAAGMNLRTSFWNHISAAPISITCGLAAWVLHQAHAARRFRSRPIAVCVLACHSLFYAGRALVLPVLAAVYGADIVAVAAKVTMYEAVLFSVAMPTSLLAIVREEDREGLLMASQTDYLTGLLNRQGFFDMGPRLLSQAPHGTPHALLACDLDHFKRINDEHGHDAGDRVLKLFATVARDCAGVGALSTRLGGEEFAVLLPSATIGHAQDVARQLAEEFARRTAVLDGFRTSVTVSVGIAADTSSTIDLTRFLARADRALYQAKREGRNRIELAPADA